MAPASPNPESSGGLSWKTLAIGVTLTVILAILVWAGVRGRTVPSGQRDDAYAGEVTIASPRVLHTDSLMAGGEIFYEGALVNHGSRALTGYSVRLTFFGTSGQVVQSEDRVLLDSHLTPLPAGGVRTFQIGFDHVSPQWNMAPPAAEAIAVYVR